MTAGRERRRWRRGAEHDPARTAAPWTVRGHGSRTGRAAPWRPRVRAAGCVDIDGLVSASAGRLAGPTPRGDPSSAPADARATFLIYEVKPGDRLTIVAKKYKTTVESIGYWNRARDGTLDPQSSIYAPDSIKVGWLLRIHPGQTTDSDYADPRRPRRRMRRRRRPRRPLRLRAEADARFRPPTADVAPEPTPR